MPCLPPNKPRLNRAFTLVELLVCVAIVAALAAMLLPSIGSSIEKAQRTRCVSNLKQIGQGMGLYLNEHDMIFPMAYDSSGLNWRYSLVRGGYMGAPGIKRTDDSSQWRPEQYDVMGCPTARSKSNKQPPFSPTYAMNANIGNQVTRLNRLTAPAQCWMIADGNLAASGNYGIALWSRGGTNSLPGTIHAGSANILYCDSHVAYMPPGQFPTDDRPGNSPQYFFWQGQPYQN